LALSVLLPSAVAAQDEPPQPLQELFFTEVVYPQDKGEVQLTFGSLVDRSREDKAALMPLSIEYGVTNRWQVEAQWAGYAHFHQSPFDDLRSAKISVGTKYSFMNIAHSRVHAATGLDVEFPDAGAFDEGEGESGTQFEPFVSMAVDVTHHFTLFGSAGFSFQALEAGDLLAGEPPDDPGTISMGGLIASRFVTFALEYTSRSDDMPWRLNGSPMLTPSVVIHPGQKWELGFGVPIGVRGGSHTPGFAMNIIKEFGGEP
ncbi:MAG TPA: hypothetical protein VK955_08385, partial [Xanthobacteraceae bacterium]|nr:hypothetical protein [Xanthobacteraceae bacterium]